MLYSQLFFAFLKIGALSFGGGYAAMPLIQAQVIEKYGWLTINDFTDLVTIAEMTPGPIALNAATFVGNQVAGIKGAICATAGAVLPSCIFVTILAFLYTRYRKMKLLQAVLKALRPAVVAMIFAAGLNIFIPAVFDGGATEFSFSAFQLRPFLYFLAAIWILRKKKTDPIKVMSGCGIAELLVQCWMRYAN